MAAISCILLIQNLRVTCHVALFQLFLRTLMKVARLIAAMLQRSSCPLPSLKSKESEDPENESGSQVHWPYDGTRRTVKSEKPENAPAQQRQGRRALLSTCLQDILLSSPQRRCVRCTFKCRMPTALQKSSCSPSASEAWDHKRHVVLLRPGLANNTARFVLSFNTHIHPLHNRASRGFFLSETPVNVWKSNKTNKLPALFTSGHEHEQIASTASFCIFSSIRFAF